MIIKYPPLEQSIRLENAGFPQNSTQYYYQEQHLAAGDYIIISRNFVNSVQEAIVAPDLSELECILPCGEYLYNENGIDWKIQIQRNKENKYFINQTCEKISFEKSITKTYRSCVEAYAEGVIYLLKNSIISGDDIISLLGGEIANNK